MVSKGYAVLTVVGILVLLLGLIFIALDFAGSGDTAGLDPKDLGIVLIGLILAIVGAALARRKTSAPGPSSPQ